MKTREEALTEALRLALIAPKDDQAERASDLAERIAAGMDRVSVERSKQEAKRLTRT